MNTPQPSRRSLLRGGLVLGTAAAAGALATPASARPGRRPRVLDYPDAHWTPASTSNYTAASRPSEYPIEFVIIHVTQETYADTIDIFQDSSAQVSAHYVVRSADGYVGQCVRDKDVAWHAGNWDYNTRSIGIEHEGWVDQPEYFTDAMYESSARLTAHLCDTYGIPKDRRNIIGHIEVPGATHTDPGPYWDWARYMDLVKSVK
ncbi:N-acetylmuramoyl-L-alanine amidase [Streptomyces sp. TP-A0874]|uniref:N-acetylmuramoyl-L-alanine amidase n=1 Tax=Streptomyces sp. TP-A0874 TaxID=549819 RepID=UPI000853E2CA|nr:peptidoglycan recognition family protein [Streptomyces sp. TP-A0874]